MLILFAMLFNVIYISMTRMFVGLVYLLSVYMKYFHIHRVDCCEDIGRSVDDALSGLRHC